MTKKEQRQREWSSRVAAYKASGLTMAAWCVANDVTLEQLKYWSRKLKTITAAEAGPSTARFIPLAVTESSPLSSPSSLIVRVGPASITLHEGFHPQSLRDVVEALRDRC